MFRSDFRGSAAWPLSNVRFLFVKLYEIFLHGRRVLLTRNRGRLHNRRSVMCSVITFLRHRAMLQYFGGKLSLRKFICLGKTEVRLIIAVTTLETRDNHNLLNLLPEKITKAIMISPLSLCFVIALADLCIFELFHDSVIFIYEVTFST
jgi:hypothetical protein